MLAKSVASNFWTSSPLIPGTPNRQGIGKFSGTHTGPARAALNRDDRAQVMAWHCPGHTCHRQSGAWASPCCSASPREIHPIWIHLGRGATEAFQKRRCNVTAQLPPARPPWALRESSVMPTARQSAKFSAGCRWRAPPGEHARPACRRPVAQHSGSERSARAGRTVEVGAGANRFSPVSGITHRRADRRFTFEEGCPASGRPCRCVKIPPRRPGASPLSQIRTCPETGHQSRFGTSCNHGRPRLAG